MVVVDLLKIAEVDSAVALDVEQAECNLVFGVWFGKKILKVAPVSECDATSASAVGDVEKNGILGTLDLVLPTDARLADKV